MKKLKEYIPLRLQEPDITETMFIEHKGDLINISEAHGIFCHEPFIIGVWSEQDLKDCNTIVISNKHNKIVVSLEFNQFIQFSTCSLYLFSITGVQFGLINALFNHYLAKMIRPVHGLAIYKRYASLYSYPRKIILTSLSTPDHTNIFPMDFQGHVSEENIVILGLRNTNITQQKIIEHKQFAVADIDLNSIQPIYELGRHHSKETTKMREFDTGVEYTDQFKVPFPRFISGYKELNLFKSINIGSHTLLIANVINAKPNKSHFHLYHISQFEFSCNNHYRQFVIK